MLILIAAAALFHSHNQYLLLQGEVDAPEVIVTSKAKGRVIDRHIERGDDVKQGQLLLTLESPELQAQYAASKAARAYPATPALRSRRADRAGRARRAGKIDALNEFPSS